MPEGTSPEIAARQADIAKVARSTLSVWFTAGGWLFFAITVLLFLVGVANLGWSTAGELLIGAASPASPGVSAQEGIVRWAVAVVGWLAIPAMIGAIVGYLVSQQTRALRGTTRDEIEANRGLEND